MKIIVTATENPNNIMEFDCTGSGLTQEELVRNIYAVAKTWLESFEKDK